MSLDTQGLMELLRLPQLPDDFEITLEVRIRAGDLRRAQSAGELEHDLNICEMAGVARRAESTVRGWLREGVDGAYKLNGRDWFCPPEAWKAELRRRIAAAGAGGAGDHVPARLRKPPALGRATPVDLGGWRAEIGETAAERKRRIG
jgi:hypothetical protein